MDAQALAAALAGVVRLGHFLALSWAVAGGDVGAVHQDDPAVASCFLQGDAREGQGLVDGRAHPAEDAGGGWLRYPGQVGNEHLCQVIAKEAEREDDLFSHVQSVPAEINASRVEDVSNAVHDFCEFVFVESCCRLVAHRPLSCEIECGNPILSGRPMFLMCDMP